MMTQPGPVLTRVSPRHEVMLAPAVGVLIGQIPDRDYVVRTLAQREAGGLQLMSAEIVIAGKETRRQFPLAEKYPLHFRKTYFPGRLRGDPSHEFRCQQKASEILDIPPPIGWTKDCFRACFIPGRPYSRLSPFGIEPLENNIALAEELPLAAAVGLWTLMESAFRQVQHLHEGGLLHGDLELHNLTVATSPLEILPIDFENSRVRGELPDADWEQRALADFDLVLREAVFLQCALGRQPGAMAEMAMENMARLFPSPGRFERKIRRLAAM